MRVTRTSLTSFLHIFKGNVGPGCLALPCAFSSMPVPLAVCAVTFVAVLTSLNSLTLTRLVPHRACLTYSELGKLRDDLRGTGSRCGEKLVTMSILLQQLSICCVYFSFVADNLSNLSVWGDMGGQSDEERSICLKLRKIIVMSAMYPVVCIWVSKVKSLSDLAWMSKYATAVLLFSFFMIILTTSCGIINIDASDGGEGEGGGVDDDSPPNYITLILGFTAVLYSFEGVCLVLPVYNSTPQKATFPGLFCSTMVTVAATYLGFGFYCVAAFGKVDNGSITAFMSAHASGRRQWLVQVLSIMLAVVVLATYPLQFFPVTEILEEHVGGVDSKSQSPDDYYVKLDSNSEQVEDGNSEQVEEEVDDTVHSVVSSNDTLGRSAVAKILLVTFTYLLAMLVPSLSLLISLAGSVAGSLVALILPGLLHRSIKGRSLFGDLVILIGFTIMIVGAWVSVSEIIRVLL